MTFVAGVTMVKDEADVIGTVIEHLFAEGVERIIVADNMSTDGTRDILEDLWAGGAHLSIIDDNEVGYYQSKKMSRLARQAHDMGADWVLPFDADEVWYSDHGTIAEALAQVPAAYSVVPAGGWDHIHPGTSTLATKTGEFDQWVPYVGPFSPWRRPQMQPLAKVCFRARPDVVVDMGNHDVMPRGTRCPPGPLAYRHFQYRSLEQMIRKLRNGRAAYEASDVHPHHGVHWREGGAKTDDEIATQWAELCATPDLVYDPAPLRVSVDGKVAADGGPLNRPEVADVVARGPIVTSP